MNDCYRLLQMYLGVTHNISFLRKSRSNYLAVSQVLSFPLKRKPKVTYMLRLCTSNCRNRILLGKWY